MKKDLRLLILASLFITRCDVSPKIFQHDITGDHLPWTAEPVRRDDSNFTFAVIGDLNGGERKGIFDVAVAQLNLLRPEFVLSVGDLIDGGTEDTVELAKQFDSFDERVAKLEAPFFHVGGNHDLTNQVMRTFWEKRYGRRYYHFVYNNVLFLMLDSEDYSEKRMQAIYEARAKAIEVLDGPNPELARDMDYFTMPERISGEIGEVQSNYFKRVIEDNPNVKWTFLFMHKPVWQREGDGNLMTIESALAQRNYTVINGHFHEYAHTQRNDRDYIILGTTGGSQDPESERSFDHITLVSMGKEGPGIANLRLDGILDKTAKIPLDGERYCFQASKCEDGD
jgi:predicted phosphodiesterase